MIEEENVNFTASKWIEIKWNTLLSILSMFRFEKREPPNCYEESNNNEAENYFWRLSKIYLSVTRVHIYITSNAGVLHAIYTK